MNPLIRLATALALLAGLISTGLAQPHADGLRGSRRGGRVLLYSDADFRGPFIELRPGEHVQDFALQTFDGGQPANDRISSIVVEGPVELIAYSDSRYRGDTLRLNESVSNLSDLPGPNHRGNWNDIISSATVVAIRQERRGGWSGGTGRGDVRGPRVELYSDANFRGSRLVLTPGDRVRNLADVGFEDDEGANDRISSIRIVGDVTVVVHEDGDFRGDALRLKESVPNLAFRSGRGGSRPWNDCISSVEVLNGGGHGPDGPSPEMIVRRAYRDILGRDVDPSGLATYTRLIEREGWSEEQVRAALRASDEYKQKRRKP